MTNIEIKAIEYYHVIMDWRVNSVHSVTIKFKK